VPTATLAEVEVRIGVDAVAVERVERLLRDHPQSCAAIFTAGELEYSRGKRRAAEHLAGRFAAKEAVLKAFGTGISRRMRWTEVEVLNEASGRPRVHLAGSAAAFADRHGLTQLDVSLTHTQGLAFAYAIALWGRSAESRGREETAACAST
jgi:holo-[acyl-carrier protein] synthase